MISPPLRTHRLLILLGLFFLAGGWLAPVACPAQDAGSSFMNETPAQHDARMAWWRAARFGLFIHWGVYSVPAGEWNGQKDYAEWFLEQTRMPVSQYEKYAAQFNPTNFDAEKWVSMAKNAGMKYIVITSKHHDGFGMFRSDLTDWCIKSTPFQSDPMKELAAACREQDITFCFYHSIMDWHHPDWGVRRPWNDKAGPEAPDMDRYTAYLKGQLRELLTRYGPIGVLWFDGQWEKPWTSERGADLYNYVRSLQPNIIINNRVGKPADSASGVGFAQKGKIGDYGTPEQEIPAKGFGPDVDWESCMTMNDHWGYNKNDHNWKSTTTLIRNLIDCSSKGGNYLLNIGPTAEGVFPEPAVERLAEIGAWMKVNSEAIYGTTASPFPKRLPWGRCTTKTSADLTTLYLHVFDWPQDGKLFVPGLRSTIQSAWLLADPDKQHLATANDDEGVTVSLPATAPDKISSTVVVQFKGAPNVAAASIEQRADGSVWLLASDANLHGDTIQYELGGPRDNIGFWTNPDDWVDWEYKIARPGRFTVSAIIGAPAATTFEVSVAGQTLHGAAPVTGDYVVFKSVDLGVVQINSTGTVTLVVHPVKTGWQPMNLKSIELKPVPPALSSENRSAPFWDAGAPAMQ